MDAPVSHLEGLSEAEAAARLAQFGPNLLRERKTRGFFEIARRTLREPMFLLLLAAASLYLLLGDLGEGLFLTGGALLSLGLVIFQELRSERALAALNALAEPLARVIRSGEQRTIPAAELVPGDLVVVGEGGRLPADGLLISGDALSVDESSLTGESVPTGKRRLAGGETEAEDPQPGEPLSPYLFGATLIVRGQGVMRIIRTGASTRVGRIGTALSMIVEEPSLLQRDVRRLITRLGILALAFCLVVAAAYGWLRGDWFQGALTGITLAISLIPEEFPMVLAVFMALGSWRLAQHNVLIRRSAVIETLGATTLLCVDKTGTITENRMALEYVWRDGELFDLSTSDDLGDAGPVVAMAQLASAVRPHDPMDAAVHRVAGKPLASAPLRSYPLRPEFLAFVQVWPEKDGGAHYAAKGAPETILRLCGQDEAAARAAEAAVQQLGARGLRVLAVASARFGSDPGTDPAALRYDFQGLLGFADPVRADVPASLEEARRAGISVALITGDYPVTALAAAEAAGIDTKGGVVTGAEVAGAASLEPHLEGVRVFARVMPEQKLRLVEAFRASGQVVAMTGDGINDAPALAAADVGIAMGQRGTDVAREASDIILLDDRFASIVGGIRLGRRIFANLRRAMTYIAAIHVPVAGLALLPILLGLPPMLLPMHLVLLELLIDPLCSLVFEGERSEEDAMKKPPRPAKEPLFGLRQILIAGVQGAVLLAAVLSLYAWLIADGLPDTEARATAFVALVIGHLTLALADAGSSASRLLDRSRKTFWIIGAAALTVLMLTLTVPPLADILEFTMPALPLLALAIALGIASGGWFRLARRTGR
ncbi:MAG TPA: cation-translocating P-type ATPase [Allosphingosinicella sp.]|nr:cation-translocating P-type ATPase [Allosphingosinicella sp.]